MNTFDTVILDHPAWLGLFFIHSLGEGGQASVRAGGKGTTAFERGARNCHRVATILLRADARTAVYPTADISDPYARRVLGAGGFKKYERAHLAALTATFAPKFPALPADAVRVVVAFCFHVGYY